MGNAFSLRDRINTCKGVKVHDNELEGGYGGEGDKNREKLAGQRQQEVDVSELSLPPTFLSKEITSVFHQRKE